MEIFIASILLPQRVRPEKEEEEEKKLMNVNEILLNDFVIISTSAQFRMCHQQANKQAFS